MSRGLEERGANGGYNSRRREVGTAIFGHFATAQLPALFLPDEKTAERFFGFFTAHIENRNTRRAYYKAACRSAFEPESSG
jgi:hypothetical protein